MEKLLLAPDADGYSSLDGTNALITALDGGPSRFRLDKIGAPKIVQVKWTMNRNQYQYWRAFYATVTVFGSLPFLCDLLSEDGNGPAEHTCSFIPGSVSLPMQRGLTYVQQASLEVTPLARNADFDNSLVALFAASEGDPEGCVLGLASLVTTTMPATLT